MRSTFLATAAMLVVGAATPTLAAVRHHNSAQPSYNYYNSVQPSYSDCEALSVERGAGPGRGGGTNAEAEHAAFMKQCLDGKIPF